ncbi:hypothetical protein [Elizabethkingia anophelis]|uniref:Glycoside hydrolase n=1 Tax=Elizabethkingia anophelis TaxID=1117645 RepID=A0AAU8VGH4_9FLAO|nr:hypothetical protein [Elizabethkingia anophelis]AQX02235.1 hypothetical protein BBD32_12585 [Elizabethkingia anophelis]OPB61483.1 hypothetical protein BAY11_17680 [Elizabethkingia anophelis]
MRDSKLLIFNIFLIFLPFITFSQKYNSPEKKYSNEYKKYEIASCPVPPSNIKKFVYFAREREAIKGHVFLIIGRFQGAQIMYPWSILEPEKGEYDFSIIKEDYQYLRSRGKKLFIQLQDTSFDSDFKAVPKYLLNNEYNGGAIIMLKDNGEPDGWVAKRWNKNVQQRFALLLQALGKEFDGKIEGINLQEVSIGKVKNPSFTDEIYVKSIKTNMLALKKGFSKSVTIQYANFMPGEWLPWCDKGYLRSIYKFGQEIGVGLGAPDLMIKRDGHLNHTIALMHERKYAVPLGIAVQDGNYTNDDTNSMGYIKHDNMVPMLSAFAKDFLKVNYIFWANQEPYFTEDVVPCFK